MRFFANVSKVKLILIFTKYFAFENDVFCLYSRLIIVDGIIRIYRKIADNSNFSFPVF